MAEAHSRAGSEHRDTLRRIAGLDGLRGIAILSVMLYHFAHVSLNGGNAALQKTLMTGWAGVDMFCVLSGFLITRIFLHMRETPDRWRNFFALPALSLKRYFSYPSCERPSERTEVPVFGYSLRGEVQ